MKKNQKSEPVKNVNRESLRMKPEPINSTADSGSTKIWVLLISLGLVSIPIFMGTKKNSQAL